MNVVLQARWRHPAGDRSAFVMNVINGVRFGGRDKRTILSGHMPGRRMEATAEAFFTTMSLPPRRRGTVTSLMADRGTGAGLTSAFRAEGGGWRGSVSRSVDAGTVAWLGGMPWRRAEAATEGIFITMSHPPPQSGAVPSADR